MLSYKYTLLLWLWVIFVYWCLLFILPTCRGCTHCFLLSFPSAEVSASGGEEGALNIISWHVFYYFPGSGSAVVFLLPVVFRKSVLPPSVFLHLDWLVSPVSCYPSFYLSLLLLLLLPLLHLVLLHYESIVVGDQICFWLFCLYLFI